jgi:hypothetical protein
MVSPQYEYEEFHRWFDEPEEYGLRSERFFSMIDSYTDPIERNKFIMRWMAAAFDAGINTCNQNTKTTQAQ